MTCWVELEDFDECKSSCWAHELSLCWWDCLLASHSLNCKLLIRWTTQQSLTTHNNGAFLIPGGYENFHSHYPELCTESKSVDLSEDKSERGVSSHCDKLGSHHKPDYDQVREKKASFCFLSSTHFHRNHFLLTVGVSATTPLQIWVEICKKDRYYSLYITQPSIYLNQRAPLQSFKDIQRTSEVLLCLTFGLLFSFCDKVKRCLYTTCLSSGGESVLSVSVLISVYCCYFSGTAGGDLAFPIPGQCLSRL